MGQYKLKKFDCLIKDKTNKIKIHESLKSSITGCVFLKPKIKSKYSEKSHLIHPQKTSNLVPATKAYKYGTCSTFITTEISMAYPDWYAIELQPS